MNFNLYDYDHIRFEMDSTSNGSKLKLYVNYDNILITDHRLYYDPSDIIKNYPLNTHKYEAPLVDIKIFRRFIKYYISLDVEGHNLFGLTYKKEKVLLGSLLNSIPKIKEVSSDRVEKYLADFRRKIKQHQQDTFRDDGIISLSFVKKNSELATKNRYYLHREVYWNDSSPQIRLEEMPKIIDLSHKSTKFNKTEHGKRQLWRSNSLLKRYINDPHKER